jgi:uncharacterized protein (DUF2141 family)
MFALAALVVVAACAATARSSGPSTGSVTGVATDHDTGDHVAQAEIRLRAQGQLSAATRVVTDANGTYKFDHVLPGTYSVSALYAGQPVDVDGVVVHAGIAAVADVSFTLGRPDAHHTVFGNEQIDRYHPRGLGKTVGRIEGSVTDTTTRDRVIGAVVTAIGPGSEVGAPVAQTVSDEQGRFHFDNVVPGVYLVSAYYQVDNHGQMEVRRTDIPVDGGEGVIVPLWVELSR